MKASRIKLIILAFLFVIGLLNIDTVAQIQVGTIRGVVTDEKGDLLPGATVTLENPVSGFVRSVVTGNDGSFAFNHVPFNPYTLRVEMPGFDAVTQDVHVRSNIPVAADVRLKVAPIQQAITVTAEKELVESDSSVTHTDLDQNFFERALGAAPNRAIESIIATTPGWVPDDNGRLHVRGTESEILYVFDGMPITDRLDTTFASSLDPGAITSLEVITGNIPAEYGNRLGGVVNAKMRSGIDTPISGSFVFGAGSFKTGEVLYRVGGKLTDTFGFSLIGSVSQSHRFLDPPDPRNFNNRGGTAKLNSSIDWHPTPNDIVHFTLSGNGTKFRVPNRLEQEFQGQRQRQDLRDTSQTMFWQHIWSANTVTNFALYRRYYQAKLFCNELCTPIFAEANRHHTHYGSIASVSHHRSKHNAKVGAEFYATPVREFFSFFITDPDRVDVTPEAARFVPGNPFVFAGPEGGRKTGRQFAAYLQDSFSPFANLTIDAGLRYDRYKLLVFNHQFSPRIGAVYFIPRTRTAIRASYNRFFMPPQIENLLLAASPFAARLSPFAEQGGSAVIIPDKQNVYEVGFAQEIAKLFRLDIAYYWRRIRNFADRDQFLDTAIIFPISIARGDVEGLDVRLDFPEQKGVSGYISYSNSRALGIGPINGGLFLSKKIGEIRPGFVFPNDHDQRNTGAFGVTYQYRKSHPWWVTFSGHYDSGLPFDVDPEDLPRLLQSPGVDLVNLTRGRVRPRTLLNFSSGVEIMREENARVVAQLDIQNLTDKRFLYNFQSVFSGTHFGYPRLWSGKIKLYFR